VQQDEGLLRRLAHRHVLLHWGRARARASLNLMYVGGPGPAYISCI
jgi:hypothetical protein